MNPVRANVASQTTRFQKTHCALVLIRKKTKAITGEHASFIGNCLQLHRFHKSSNVVFFLMNTRRLKAFFLWPSSAFFEFAWHFYYKCVKSIQWHNHPTAGKLSLIIQNTSLPPPYKWALFTSVPKSHARIMWPTSIAEATAVEKKNPIHKSCSSCPFTFPFILRNVG